MFAMWWRLAVLGAFGVASLLLAPLEQLVPLPIDPLAVRALSMIQPAVLTLLMAALGLWAAPKVGLDAPVVRAWAEGKSVWPALRPQLVPAVLGGLAVAALLVAYANYLQTQPAAAPLLTLEMPLPTRLLYGGIIEELLLRWGILSLFVWLAWRAGGARRPVPSWCIWTGLTVAALLFAAGHLPVLHMLLPDPPVWLTGLIVAANALPGLLFGWLFWRRGLEAAMGAHALAHLFAWAALAIA
jgi:hypothetical protein